jgi:hypothetical protein
MNVGRYVRASKIVAKYIVSKTFKGTSIKKAPIFILGCGHSGTSIILRVIGQHPNIYAVKHESRMAMGSKSRFRKYERKFNITAVSEERIRWIEKTPRHIRNIEKILKWSPKSKIILVIRDGRDVACSMKKRYGDIKTGVERWVRDNEEGQKYWGHERVLLTKHEDFVRITKKEVKKYMKFIDENFRTNLLKYHESEENFYSDEVKKPEDVSENHEKYRNWQINQSIFDGSGRWKNETSNQDKKVVKEIVSDKLIEYGYAEGYKW